MDENELSAGKPPPVNLEPVKRVVQKTQLDLLRSVVEVKVQSPDQGDENTPSYAEKPMG